MRPTLYYLRPRSTRPRPAPPVPGSLAWQIAEIYRETTPETLRTLRDGWRPAIELLANGNARVNDPLYTPVWSVAEDEMTSLVTSGGLK